MTLNVRRTLTLAYSSALSPKQSLSCNEVLNSSCNLLNRKVKNRVAVSVPVVYPCDCVADSELQPSAAAQHQERASCCMLLVQGKIKIQNSSTDSTEYVTVLHHHETEKS